MDGSKGWKKKSDVWNEVVRDFNVLSQVILSVQSIMVCRASAS